MINSKLFILLITVISFFQFACYAQDKNMVANTAPQTKIVGGGCEGCELMYVGIPSEIKSVDYSSGWTEKGQKLLVTGIIYQLDGRTPAPDVILYYWQTDNNGYYSPKKDMPEKAKPHGHIRGWIKTGKDGKYSIYTIRPAPYPNENEPAHIHISIKEPNLKNEYYIDDLVFDDDKLLLPAIKKRPLENRGGNGILRVLLKADLQIAEHNVILGLNIPNYPESVKNAQQSGLAIGQDSPSFIPYHAWGADKGERACPVCRYGRFHGILYFVGKKTNWNEIKNWLSFFEQESIKRGKYLKVYFIYGNEINFSEATRRKELEQLGEELNLKNVALTFVPSLDDKLTEVNLNKINTSVENTFIIYRHRKIIDKYINLKPTKENFALITTTLDKTKSEYFDLPEPPHN